MPTYSNNPFMESGLGPDFQAAQQRLDQAKADAQEAAGSLEDAKRRIARHHEATKSLPSEEEVLELHGLVAKAESKAVTRLEAFLRSVLPR